MFFKPEALHLEVLWRYTVTSKLTLGRFFVISLKKKITLKLKKKISLNVQAGLFFVDLKIEKRETFTFDLSCLNVQGSEGAQVQINLTE